MKFPPWLEALLADLSHFPWRDTAITLRNRFREDRMGLTASSLTFTTSIALVPFFTVALAVFTAFPMFSTLQAALQAWLVRSLIPDNISRQVLGYLTQFSGQASKLGGAGLAVLLVTAIALILTIDRTLNSIWRVRKPRPLAQRVLIYWAAITLGPLVLGASLAVTSYVVSASSGLVGVLPFSVRFVLDVAQFFLVAGGMAALYRYVPNTYVKWGHAFAGGLFVAAGIEIGKKVLGAYMTAVPTYSMVYGAFAALPILLVWIYVSWVIVLMGAVISAYLPSLLAGVTRRGSAHGWQFQLAIEILQMLDKARITARMGVSASQLAEMLELDVLQFEPVLETLVEMDWIGQLNDAEGNAESRYVLLADPETTQLEPLMQQLLLDRAPSVHKLWEKAGWRTLLLRDSL
ncbi:MULTISPECIES: YihY family inner membrane protein [unclassified Polaromonas]|jgi:membrane protein|uniref:YihY family inner membrane protein n=1 Tax=unclassified Polaromonas TaxID=2638319 RepID=UPI0018CB7F06|nr:MULTISPECIES: YihY family inner membrane protein [unclassified Polaromonas]MBG6072751.1 membrane protein [Polaromonas sp. CG_9.7]MBG6114755.1 membrane protein [Polaromonas sp. CG_9.2]MDH6184602.1 membrane protein [Polaromonas sp. CG_23.6]